MVVCRNGQINNNMAKFRKGDKVTVIDINAPCIVEHVTPYHEDGDNFANVYLQNVVNKARYVIPVAIQDTVLKAGHPTKTGPLSGQIQAEKAQPKLTIFQKVFGKR